MHFLRISKRAIDNCNGFRSSIDHRAANGHIFGPERDQSPDSRSGHELCKVSSFWQYLLKKRRQQRTTLVLKAIQLDRFHQRPSSTSSNADF
jgi:hypothetical protein